MKIEIIKDRLGEAVSRAEKISSKNPTLPALAGLYLKAENNTLTIKATNLDLGISVTIPAKVAEDGDVLVPASVLGSFLNSLPNGRPVTLSYTDGALEVVSGGSETSIKTLSKDDFPIIPELSDDKAFSMPAKDLAAGLKAVVYSAAVGSMKPELSSVLVSYEDGSLVFAATDSFRLGEKKVAVKNVPHFTKILIPQKNALELARIFEREDGDVSVSLEEHQAAFRVGGTYLASRTVEGSFPDYRQIIPKESTTKAVLLKEDLASALKTNTVFSDAFNQLILRVSPSKKLFEIESKNANVGAGKTKVEAALEGEDLTTSVNHRYFADCFGSIASDSLSVSFNGQGRAIVVEGVGDKTFLYLVMPMNRS